MVVLSPEHGQEPDAFTVKLEPALNPRAKTSSEKLSMKGEPINVNNIAKQVEDELNNLSHTITDFAKDISNKNWK